MSRAEKPWIWLFSLHSLRAMASKSKLLLFFVFALACLAAVILLFALFAPLSILLMLYSFILAGSAFLAASLYSWWLEKREENPLILLFVPLALLLTGLFLIVNGFYLA